MNKSLILILLILFLAGCESLKKGLGVEKDIPDEFLVKKNNPLKKPPNYDLLPLPEGQVKNKKTTKAENENLKSIIEKNIRNQKTKSSTEASNIENDILEKIK